VSSNNTLQPASSRVQNSISYQLSACSCEIAKGFQQPARDRPGVSVADRSFVDGHDRYHFTGRAGKERFVGIKQVIVA
jgi:hypothetical protein